MGRPVPGTPKCGLRFYYLRPRRRRVRPEAAVSVVSPRPTGMTARSTCPRRPAAAALLSPAQGAKRPGNRPGRFSSRHLERLKSGRKHTPVSLRFGVPMISGPFRQRACLAGPVIATKEPLQSRFAKFIGKNLARLMVLDRTSPLIDLGLHFAGCRTRSFRTVFVHRNNDAQVSGFPDSSAP